LDSILILTDHAGQLQYHWGMQKHGLCKRIWYRNKSGMWKSEMYSPRWKRNLCTMAPHRWRVAWKHYV